MWSLAQLPKSARPAAMECGKVPAAVLLDAAETVAAARVPRT